MNAALPASTVPVLMTAADYRESLRRYRPTVYVDGQRVDSVADAPGLQPGINALGVSYDYAHDPAMAPLMTARQSSRRAFDSAQRGRAVISNRSSNACSAADAKI